MTSTFQLTAAELNLSFLNSIKEAYKGKNIEIIISDITESDKADVLLNRIKNIRENKNTIEFSADDFFSTFNNKIANASDKI